jgi:hypothetical protein
MWNAAYPASRAYSLVVEGLDMWTLDTQRFESNQPHLRLQEVQVATMSSLCAEDAVNQSALMLANTMLLERRRGAES